MIAESTAAKVVFNFFTVCLGGIMGYLGINGEAFFLFAVLLLLDYLTGIWKAKALGHAITSNRMKYGVISKMSLLLIPLVLAIGAKAVEADFKYVLMYGINILVLSEVYSIFGNIYTAKTREHLPEYDAVAMIGKRIRRALMKYSEE